MVSVLFAFLAMVTLVTYSRAGDEEIAAFKDKINVWKPEPGVQLSDDDILNEINYMVYNGLVGNGQVKRAIGREEQLPEVTKRQLLKKLLSRWGASGEVTGDRKKREIVPVKMDKKLNTQKKQENLQASIE